MKVFGFSTDSKDQWTAPYSKERGIDTFLLLAFALISTVFFSDPNLLFFLLVLPLTTGCKLRLMGGNLVSPNLTDGTFRPGREGEHPNWFNFIPTYVRLDYFATPCNPFFTIRMFSFGFYLGHKIFGMDSEAYKDYPGIKEEDVYVGSQALTGFTARFTNKLN